MNNLKWVQTSDLNLLTCGSDDLTYEENINIIKHVFNFIKSSKRFLVVKENVFGICVLEFSL
jgi:hypothetical protein